MSKQRVWHSVDEIFRVLNESNCNYIVMRNFECFESGQVFMNGHDDIDLLCDDKSRVCKVLDARKRLYFPTVNSYYIKFNDLTVSVDIRFIGDGYYDKQWQIDMLRKKTLFNDQIYVPDIKNYFYSLTYHAIIQKNFLSDEYLKKLCIMASELGINCTTEEQLLEELFRYIKENDYKITITRDPGIILNFKNVGDIDIKSNRFWLIKRKILNALKHFKCVGDKYV